MHTLHRHAVGEVGLASLKPSNSLRPPSRTLPQACNGLRATKMSPLLRPSTRQRKPFVGLDNLVRAKRNVRVAGVGTPELAGVALFFAPSIAALIYAYFKGKGNIKDGLSRLLTAVSQGYFQPDVGGKNIPISQGELSDLAGDEPLFKALYKWCACPS